MTFCCVENPNANHNGRWFSTHIESQSCCSSDVERVANDLMVQEDPVFSLEPM